MTMLYGIIRLQDQKIELEDLFECRMYFEYMQMAYFIKFLIEAFLWILYKKLGGTNIIKERKMSTFKLR